MSKPAEQTIRRIDLHDLVWSEPMRDIAARFGKVAATTADVEERRYSARRTR